MGNVEELQRALDYPWDRWMIFLHPEQRELVERRFGGPFRVSGSAGTGKTIVALHRAVFLARANLDARILLATFSEPLANALRGRLRRLLAGEPQLAERIDVHAVDTIGLRLFKSLCGPIALASPAVIREFVTAAAAAVQGHKFATTFLLAEWDQVVDAWQLESWEAYREVPRLGRRTRLPEKQRRFLWSIFDRVRAELTARKLVTPAAMFTRLAAAIAAAKSRPFDFAIIDEAQDIGIAQLRLMAALGAGKPDALFFAGDLGQRIFQQPFSWLALGIDIRGRSRTLRVNYRTSHQIRMQADRLLGPEVADVDGVADRRTDTVSMFNGPPPLIRTFENQGAEIAAVADWLVERRKAGLEPHEIAVFVRSDTQLERAVAAAERAGIPARVLDEKVEMRTGELSISTMHLAKGLEFRAVAVMACDDEVIPLQARIASIGDESDLKEVYDTERQLLYVACTRARDHLLVTCVEPGSEFLDDLEAGAGRS